jgi:hypothetical protein
MMFRNLRNSSTLPPVWPPSLGRAVVITHGHSRGTNHIRIKDLDKKMGALDYSRTPTLAEMEGFEPSIPFWGMLP